MKRERYFNQLNYWSEKVIENGCGIMAPIALAIETPNLVRDTVKLVKTKIHNLERDKTLNIINETDYKKVLKKLIMIDTYLNNRNAILKRG